MNERRTILNDGGGGGGAEGVTLRVTTTDGSTNVGIEMVVTNGSDVYPVTTDSQGKVVLTGLSGGYTIDCETHILSVTWFTATGTMTVDISAYVDTFPVGTVRSYGYSGSYSSVALVPGSYKLQVWGAQGGSNAADSSYSITAKTGGKGGYSDGVLTLSSKQTVRVYVGGQGTSSSGGYNGGGSTTGSSSYSTGTSGQDGYEFGISKMGGGGGATDIRLSSDLYSRMIVAGGGSGGAMCYQKKTASTTTWTQVGSGNSGTPLVYNGSVMYRSYTPTLSSLGLSVGDKIRITCTPTTYCHSSSQNRIYPQLSTNVNTGEYFPAFASSAEFTIPANTTQISIQSAVQNYSSTVAGTSLSATSDKIIDLASGSTYNKYISATGYSCVWYSVTSYRNSHIKITGCTSSYTACIAYTTAIPSVGNSPSYATGWSIPTEYSSDIETTVPSDASYLYIRYAIPSHTYSDQNLVIMKYPHAFSCVIEKAATTTTTTTNTDYQVGFAGGGTTGGGYDTSYQGKQNAAGTNGSFGQGANATKTNYRYCSAGGGGGWYGGGGGQLSNTSMSNVCYSGGGSGFVNIAANASYRPSGYSSLQLDSGETIAGSTSIPKTSGSGTETGHAGNGYAKITRLAALRTAVFTLLDETGTPLSGKVIKVTGSGKTYSLTTDSSGEVAGSLISGTYTVSCQGYTLDVESVTVTGTNFFVLNVTGMAFAYTGSTQSMTLDAGTYKIECWGAQGGSYSTTYYGGKGGYSVGEITLEEATTIYAIVGGQGTKGTNGTLTAGGYNGGGASYSSSTTYIESSGGGATDVRIGTNSTLARVIVAGGGGGAGRYSSSSSYSGGAGGGTSGRTPSQYSTSYKAGTGGTQTARGTSYHGSTADSSTYGTLAAFRNGGGATSGKTYPIAGGGGGWYGGGYSWRGAGGGGSGYVYTEDTAANYPDGCLLDSSHYLANAQTIAGNVSMPSTSGGTETGHAGNGYVKITRIS